MRTATVQILKQFQALKDVPDDQLQWLIDNSSVNEFEEGDYLFKGGDKVTGTHFILEGQFRMFSTQEKGERNFGFIDPNDITGYLPFSRAVTSAASGQATENSVVMSFPREKTKELIDTYFELTQALVHVMTSRVRDFTAQQQQNEKMLALGKLSAGLAHELNNPTAAIVRGSTLLQKHLKLQPESFKRLMSIKMSEAEVDAVNKTLFEILGRNDNPVLTMMQRMELEDELELCMDDLQIENSRDIAENFVEFGFTCNDLNAFASLVNADCLPPVLNWINNNLVTERMVSDIRESSQRIEQLIGSVKNFTHMDRDTDKQFTDIHQGIASTLTMLAFKQRKGNIEVVENYAKDLPPVKAFVGELNQVWTNLIDNAIDAMEVNEKGILEIETKKEKENVVVSITDNGQGIPGDMKDKIFDPFFTTKDIGKGTGLGLDVVTRIVKQHNGAINVESIPGKTTFTICFPIND